MDLFREQLPSSDSKIIRDVVAKLPALPSLVRYHDDFDDTQRSIRNLAECSKVDIHYNGRAISLSFEHSSEDFATLMKHVLVLMLGKDLGPGTALDYLSSGKKIDAEMVSRLLAAGPLGISSVWVPFLALNHPRHTYNCAKATLHLLAKYRVNGWSEIYEDVLAALPLPFYDKYAVVRSGDAFLSVDAEAAIVRFLDEVADECSSRLLAEEVLQDAAMLLCAYQFGMRPVQIAMLTFRDVRIRLDRTERPGSVHLTFRMVKQRGKSAVRSLLRRVKLEWVPIFASLRDQAHSRGIDPGQRVFGVQSSHEAGRRIALVLRRLIGGSETAYALRHTAAQRLVDAGASHEELAEFLGHTDSTTALVYYETSSNQAERVNRALGISDIYQRVARIAHSRFIAPEDLAQLKGDQQIAGVPHGVVIAGIGGCASGQPACPFNPIMSCYGCRKFMPVQDIGMHSKVLADLRGIVRFFHSSSRSDSVSPAYLQLERTIAEVQAVVVELKGTAS